ncbi:methyltransferase family protein [Micromonospora aurantiaca (nom. illeg.)]|uniref:Isoprenylcysteine carboxylmethyltransferase family protein n=2 Tax=Micromonospora TaxID=1873 RepID=A0ABS3VJZ3_MICEH|nr:MULTISPECIES: methyltransferase [Micromonospora]MBC9005720.1 isoprenylcysteine carboxylmethyltransferase family protein [Micromonospora aurantiaca]MBO4204768.1 isoprenylcysteine carboxylmethyltransferase family protein [Micromonospora echinofusca]WDQ00030.1 NnrU family protein [Micromonospora chalcea]
MHAAPHSGAGSRPQIIAWSLVAAQLLLIAAVAVAPARPGWPVPWPVRLAGAAVTVAGAVLAAAAAAGLGRGLTASPLPNDAARLRTTGLYRRVRHPVYSGLLLAAAGWIIASGSLPRAIAAVALAALLAAKSRWEETQLTRRFPDYPAYAARTPRFMPRPWPRRSRQGQHPQQ